MIDEKAYHWLNENQLSYDIWEKKYRYNDESFDEWLDRVSGGDVELRELIKDKKFLFGGRILANRGTNKDGRKISLSNCYVITPPEDNLESIFECATKLARTYSYGGGCGIDIGKLAPKGATIHNAAKETSGAVSFMDLYSMVTGLIGQNGRRGALMISIPCDHPDVEEFIGIKSDLDRVTKANISIRITDKFMAAVKNKQSFKLKFTRVETDEQIIKEVNAYDLFHKICEMNWDYAEPGMLFWDRIENWNLLSADSNFKYGGVNPCAEEPLPSGGSCLLGSLNLSEFVTNKSTFDFDGFKKAVVIAVKGLNVVLDEGLPLHPLQEQRDSVRDWRQIGLGIFGLADLLIKLGIRYGSPESLELCDNIGFLMAHQAIRTSSNLAKATFAYPKFNEKAVEQSAFFIKHTDKLERADILETGLHNSQLLTIAPTGTLSTMLGVSGGIEPIFANYYTRKTESLHGHDEYYKVYTPIVKEYMERNGLTSDEDLPDYFITAPELPYEERIDMQAIWQSHIDASISSTVNLANSATVEDVENLYMSAWKKGLKGVTIFRDGCKRTGILTTDKKTTDDEPVPANTNPREFKRGMIIKVNNDTVGKERHLQTGCGTLHMAAFFDPSNGDLLECYLSKGSTGGCQSNLAGISRLISLSARGGVDVYAIADQLKSCPTCPSYAVRHAKHKDTSIGDCCPSAIANALLEMYKEMQMDISDEDGTTVTKKPVPVEMTTVLDKEETHSLTCPECGEALSMEGGCMVCHSCGYSKCE